MGFGSPRRPQNRDGRPSRGNDTKVRSREDVGQNTYSSKEDDWARYSDPKTKRLFEDFRALEGLVQTLKKDRDMRESQKRRPQIRR